MAGGHGERVGQTRVDVHMVWYICMYCTYNHARWLKDSSHGFRNEVERTLHCFSAISLSLCARSKKRKAFLYAPASPFVKYVQTAFVVLCSIFPHEPEFGLDKQWITTSVWGLDCQLAQLALAKKSIFIFIFRRNDKAKRKGCGTEISCDILYLE